MAEFGIPGSRLRNPTLAAVLHDLNPIAAKVTGIRTMRRLAAEAGLTLPEFHSSRDSDEFRVTLFLHNLLSSDESGAWRAEVPPGRCGITYQADGAQPVTHGPYTF